MDLTKVTKAAGAHRRKKRVGRGIGSGHGKTCGRGTKGSGARAGGEIRRLTEGGQMPLFRRLPKRGFSNAKFRAEVSIVNVSQLHEAFEDGARVTREALKEAGLIRSADGIVKVLGNGELGKKLTVEVDRFSAQAAQKIQAAGGTATPLGQ